MFYGIQNICIFNIYEQANNYGGLEIFIYSLETTVLKTGRKKEAHLVSVDRNIKTIQ